VCGDPGWRCAGVAASKRRGHAAFAKITTGVLRKRGRHNPLAVAVGQEGRSEWALELLAQLPGPALLVADRLHGCAAFVAAARAAFESLRSRFLIRARTNLALSSLDSRIRS
jgi:hypothetical protein